MHSPRKAIGYGVVIWLVAFLAAFAIFPLRETARPVFESIMPLVLAATAGFFGLRYLRRVPSGHAREGLLLGMVWLATNVAIDLPLMLSPSPMQMTPLEYAGDIGLTYMLFPIITTALGRGMDRAARVPDADR